MTEVTDGVGGGVVFEFPPPVLPHAERTAHKHQNQDAALNGNTAFHNPLHARLENSPVPGLPVVTRVAGGSFRQWLMSKRLFTNKGCSSLGFFFRHLSRLLTHKNSVPAVYSHPCRQAFYFSLTL